MPAITYCQECEHCFENKRSKTGYSCSVWGYDDFACDTVPDGFCHKAKPKDYVYILTYCHRFETVSEALDVINKMKHICEYYGVATRRDYLDLIGKPASKTSFNEGWLLEHIEKFTVVKADKDGYYIRIPNPLPID